MNETATPPRSLAQRKQALKKANEIRTHRAVLKKDLLAEPERVHGIFDDPKCDTMKVVEVLLALPKVGRVKANRVFRRARISPSKTVGGLTERQRADLFESLRFVRALNGNGARAGE